jgi:bacillithiol system protein YtxJ
MNWIALTSIVQIEEIKKLSQQNPILIFKHSTRCGISRAVLRKFEQKYSNSESKVSYYYLDLLKFRTISNEISSVFKVYHQSPQVIVIKNGEQIAHHSHYDIISDLNVTTLI